MEDALVQDIPTPKEEKEGLNPCFNGRCTRTFKAAKDTDLWWRLNPCFNGRCTRTFRDSKS